MVSIRDSYKVIIQVFIVVLIALDKADALQGYNANCNNATDICDSSKLLVCVPVQNTTSGKCECTINSNFNEGNKKCQCNKEFIEGTAGACDPAFGKGCSPTKGCNSDRLFCDPEQNNRCVCSLDYESNGKDDCFLRIGISCAGNNKGLECGKNSNTSECSNSTDLCLCKKGYTPNLSLTNCYKGFNQICTETADSKCEECNRDQGLSCINGKCNCRLTHDQIYDEGKLGCVSKMNKRCTLKSEAQESLQCEKGAECVRISDFNHYHGQCKKSTSGGTINYLFFPLIIIALLCSNF